MNIKDRINETAKLLEENYKEQGIFELGIGMKLPKRAAIVEIINEIRRVMFPGFFGTENIAYVSLDNFAGNTLAGIYLELYKQIRIAFMFQNQKLLANGREPIATSLKEIEEMAEKTTFKFFEELPKVQKMLLKDVQALFDGDPAAQSLEDVIFSYPGLYAIFVYRIAHILYQENVPFVPRIMTEFAHSKTGIDINPGAVIGEYFHIDHGTGIVIGETCEIGNHVKLYQGVTLGALSTIKGQELSGKKRHPTIGDNVVIYSNTTILGGETIIGKNSVIAGNTFVTYSIPENTRVSPYVPELQIQKRD
ncbi:MAG: serine O-acetyltransferase [Phascolarctobacterium sp.]|nr:serine O-acetyltransferase [Phascolarctobacterium sp.]